MSETKPTSTRGFASPNYDREKQREIARRGGQAAHKAGTAHKWQKGSSEPREAGRKGGLAGWRKKKGDV